MRALIICVVAILFMSCHTNKQATTETKVVETTETVERQETFIKMLDSLRITTDIEVSDISYSMPFVVSVNGKDSVVTSKVEIGKVRKRDNVERAQKQEIENKGKSETHKKTDSEIKATEITEKVVVAEPISWGWLWWVLMGAGAIVGGWWLGKWGINKVTDIR